jgi:RNA polymerase sigma-70 factor (ECF subfamily)
MDLYQVKDDELVMQFIEGNQSSIEVLINRHKNRVFTYIILLVKNQELAEDIFQDTFIKVIKSLRKGKYQEKGIFLAWVVRIAHNLIIDHFRKERNLKTLSKDQNEVNIFNSKRFAEKNIEDNLIQDQISQDVRNLVEELPFDQKQVILLRHYGGLSFKEIADQTGVSINTALGRMRYALINLRKLINEKNLVLTAI